MDISVRVLKKKYIHSLRMGLFQIVSMIVTVPLADPLVKQICSAEGSCQTSSTYIFNQATICKRQISDLLDFSSSSKPDMSNSNNTDL